MLQLLLSWALYSLILLLVSAIIPGVWVSSFGVALLATFVLALVNLIIKPILALLTLPINILTLGIFSFVLNALMFGLAAWMVPGFEVTNFWAALFGSLLMALVSGILPALFSSKPLHS